MNVSESLSPRSKNRPRRRRVGRSNSSLHAIPIHSHPFMGWVMTCSQAMFCISLGTHLSCSLRLCSKFAELVCAVCLAIFGVKTILSSKIFQAFPFCPQIFFETMVIHSFLMFPVDFPSFPNGISPFPNGPMTPQELLVGGGAPNRDVFVPQALPRLMGKHGFICKWRQYTHTHIYIYIYICIFDK